MSQGANGKTFDEIKNVLFLNDKGKVQKKFYNYTRSIRRGAREATLSIASRIYVQKGYTISKKFLNANKQHLKNSLSPVRKLDFAQSVNAAQTINHFVELRTNNKIKNFISPESINDLTRVVLVNAVYFKANWEHQFDKKKTKRGTFYRNGRETVPADFMFIHQEFNNGYVPNLDAATLQMKYANTSFSMVFVLPNDNNGLNALESKLNNYDLASIVDQMESGNIEVTIPKFKIEYESSLKSALQNVRLDNLIDTNLRFN